MSCHCLGKQTGVSRSAIPLPSKFRELAGYKEKWAGKQNVRQSRSRVGTLCGKMIGHVTQISYVPYCQPIFLSLLNVFFNVLINNWKPVSSYIILIIHLQSRFSYRQAPVNSQDRTANVNVMHIIDFIVFYFNSVLHLVNKIDFIKEKRTQADTCL